jgi:hypothetical protein
MRYHMHRTNNNEWEVYSSTTHMLVAKVYDKKTLALLIHAPAEHIMAKIQKRIDKKHYRAFLSKDQLDEQNAPSDNLTKYVQAVVNYFRRL